MDLFWATIYGLIQGVTEFLPISSSGHLAVIPFLFTLEDPGVLFDLMMHLGTAIAVILYFRKDILKLITGFFGICRTRNINEAPFVCNFLLATFFSFVFILVLKKFALEHARVPIYIGINLIVFGIIMYFSDRSAEKNINMGSELKLKEAILIGIAQSFAIFPGVSRSGITLTMGRFLGLGREEAGRFSFLLSLPVILGSIVFKLPDILNGGAGDASLGILFYAVLCSFVFGLVTIHFFLKLIARIGLVHFSIYRVLFGSYLLYLIYSA